MQSIKEELIKHLEQDIYCRIGVSKIHGVGVIAIKDIPEGINPFKTLIKRKEKVITLTDKDIINVDENTKKVIKDFFGSKNGYDVLLDGPNNINISFYMNHSNKPNINIIEDEKEEYLSFRTNRIIKKGEELLINYKDYDKY
jgi:SET domain-containing protein